jgi:hypothetical protein
MALFNKPEGRGFESLIVFNLLNLPSRIISRKFTEPLTEISTRRYVWGKAWSAPKADNLIVNYEPILQTM